MADYLIGLKSFVADIIVMFIPFMTLCFWYREDEIDNAADSIVLSLIKLSVGYLSGKIWATAVHYALHHPILYRFHKRHHSGVKSMVASKAWEDSW